jgi:hypothetical protein
VGCGGCGGGGVDMLFCWFVLVVLLFERMMLAYAGADGLMHD